MILVEANTKMLLMRFNAYKNNDFIKAHKEIIDKNDCVWMLKIGRTIQQDKIHSLMRNKGYLVLHAPKRLGGNYYIARIVDSFNGLPSDNMEFPMYYYDMLKDPSVFSLTSLEGTWIKISSIELIPKEHINSIKLVSNNRDVEEVINTTMTPTLYIYNDTEIRTEAIIQGE